MVIQKNLKGLERMEVLMASPMKGFFGNKCNSYIHTVQNAKAISTRIVYVNVHDEKIVNGLQRYKVNVVSWVLNTPLVLIIAKKFSKETNSLYSEAATESYKVTNLL